MEQQRQADVHSDLSGNDLEKCRTGQPLLRSWGNYRVNNPANQIQEEQKGNWE